MFFVCTHQMQHSNPTFDVAYILLTEFICWIVLAVELEQKVIDTGTPRLF